MTPREKRELLRALLDYVDICLERGRLHAAEEALLDAKRLDATMSDDAGMHDLREAA